MTFEKALWERGFFSIAGVDEAGRGAWAGPVAAGAVILPTDPNLLRVLDGAMDSKMMTPKERAELEPRIRSAAAACGVGMADNDEIDRIGILPATRLAMARAIAALSVSPDYLLIDYVQLPEQKIPQQSIKHGDALSLSIACGSILAKVSRDRWMREFAASEYPTYGFEKHKGYGTKMHQDALYQDGPCPIHRKTFRPIAPENPKLF